MERFFNKNLKYIRQQKNISQQELADKLNLDRSTISRWENDEMDVTVGNALLVANYFNIPIEDFTSKDLSTGNRNDFDELELLFDKNKDILTDEDKEYIKFIIEKRKKAKPDFISYDARNVPNRFVRKYNRLPLLVWCVRSQEEYMKVVKYCDNIIFENFEPKI